MEIEKTLIDGLAIIKPEKFSDERGIFMEIYSEKKYLENKIINKSVQINYSHSKKSVLRGLHYQINQTQGKIVQAINGVIFDVGIDLRKNSSTYGEQFSIELDSSEGLQVYFPPGIAHGFCVLSEYADIIYQCDEYYSPKDEYGVHWADPELNIDWPCSEPIISKKDQALLTLDQIPLDKLPSV